MIQEINLFSQENKLIVSRHHHMYNDDECDIHMVIDIDVSDHKPTIYRFSWS